LRILGFLGYNGLDRSVGIFLSEVDGRNAVIANSVDLRIDEAQERSLVGKYVIFSGIYHAPKPPSDYNGYFDQVRDLKLWSAGDPPNKH